MIILFLFLSWSVCVGGRGGQKGIRCVCSSVGVSLVGDGGREVCYKNKEVFHGV